MTGVSRAHAGGDLDLGCQTWWQRNLRFKVHDIDHQGDGPRPGILAALRPLQRQSGRPVKMAIDRMTPHESTISPPLL